VSALGVEEQRVQVLIDLDPATPGPVWGDGWRVVVRILTRQEADVLRVPVSAVFPWPATVQPSAASASAGGAPDGAQVVGERMGVFVLEGGRARLRAVQVAARNGSLAWVRAGLALGEMVIAYPPMTVTEGVRVQPR
jgi:HlyD family secretion protein